MAPQDLLSTEATRTLLFVGSVMLLISVRSLFMPVDVDFWWHVRTGQIIVETGSIPTADPYSHTAFGQPWVIHEWLAEVLFYLGDRYLGDAGLAAVFGALNVVLWLLVYANCRSFGMGQIPAALFVFWGVFLSLGIANPRPQVFTAAGLAVVTWALTQHRFGCRGALWLLPPLFAVWVNLHGGYVIGLGLLGLTLVGEWWARRSAQAHVPVRPLVVAAGLSGLATLANPHGLAAWWYPFTYYLSADNITASLTAEFSSPDFHNPIHLMFAPLLLLAVFVGVNHRPLRVSDILVLLVFAVLALQSRRNIPLFAIVAIPLLAARLQEMYPRLRLSVTSVQRPWVFIALAGIVVALFVLPLVVYRGKPVYDFRALLLEKGYPVGAAHYLRGETLEGNLFNPYDWGGYLIHELYPDRRVFVDGRADMYGRHIIEQYLTTYKAESGWRDVFAEYDIRLAILPPKNALAEALRHESGWRQVYADEVAVMLTRSP